MHTHDKLCRYTRLYRVLSVTVLAVLGPSLFAAPPRSPEQPARSDESSPFGDVIDVELVNVEVWVTDKKGNPISDLTAADFKVREDGESVEITHFTEMRDGRPAATAGLEYLDARASDAEVPAAPASDPGYLLLYFDEVHMTVQSRKRSVSSLRRFIADDNVPAERVMILRQGTGLETVANFDSSAADLDAAFDTIAKTRSAGSQAMSEKQMTLSQLQNIWKLTQGMSDPCVGFVNQAHAELAAYAAQRRSRTLNALDQLATITSFLAGFPGVKTFIYVSDAMEVLPGDDLLVFVNDRCPPATQRDYKVTLNENMTRPLEMLTRHANANRVTLYPWQAMGLMPSFFGSAASEMAPVAGLEVQMRASDRQGLGYLAAETGGRLLTNKNDFQKELRGIARDMSTYYSLAYVPPHGGDGGEHTIKIDVAKIDGKKTLVRHRRAYRHKGSDERMNEKLQSALFLGQVSNPLAARLGSGEVRTLDDGLYSMALHVMVPAKSVVFLPQEMGEIAQLQVKVGARNTTNGKVAYRQTTFTAPRPDDGGDFDIRMPLDLEEGIHILAVGLRDQASKEASYLTTAVEIKDPGGP